MKRNKDFYFKRVKGDPEPVVVESERRVHFSEVDAIGIVWHGRYPLYFEEGSEDLGRLCGLTYKDFHEAGLRAPIVKLHINYHIPLRLAEEFTIRSSLIWDNGSRLNTEYHLINNSGSIATSGYTVQLFTDAESGEACMVSPDLLERCRDRWRAGELG